MLREKSKNYPLLYVCVSFCHNPEYSNEIKSVPLFIHFDPKVIGKTNHFLVIVIKML